MDVPVVAVAFHDQIVGERPFYVLAHDGLLMAGGKYALGRAGIVFPGGDYDVFWPTTDANEVDSGGREGYIRPADRPGVSIGGQQQAAALDAWPASDGSPSSGEVHAAHCFACSSGLVIAPSALRITLRKKL